MKKVIKLGVSLVDKQTTVHRDATLSFESLVVYGVLRISQVKDDGTVRSGTTTVAGEDVIEVNGAVEAQGTIVVDVNPVTLVVSGSIEDGNLVKAFVSTLFCARG